MLGINKDSKVSKVTMGLGPLTLIDKLSAKIPPAFCFFMNRYLCLKFLTFLN